MKQTGLVVGSALQERFARAAERLVAESAVEMTAAEGGVVEVWTISSSAGTIWASAPRLAVRVGMVLSCRLLIAGEPWTVCVRVAQAQARSEDRAALVLKVVEARPDALRRSSERHAVSISVSLTALLCDRVVPGEVLMARIDDLSEGGLGIHVVDRRLTVGDILNLSARWFDGMVDAEVSVRSVRHADAAGTQLGCAFRSPTAESVATVRAIIERIGNVGAREPMEIRSRLNQAGQPAAQPTGPRHRPTVLRPAWQRQ